MEITKEQRVVELRESLAHIEHYLELLLQGQYSYQKPLSVELRKLLCEGEGNFLLKKLEKDYGVIFKFSIRSEPLMPPTYKDATVDDYLNEFRFFQEGESYTRRRIIKIVADKKGAHLDDTEKPFHQFEKKTFLPVGNPSKEGVHPLAAKYLVDIAKTTLRVCTEMLPKLA